MLVTKIEPVTKTKFKIFLEEKFAFVLYKGELARYGIKEGAILEEKQYHEILNTILLKRAKLRAMHLLEMQDRTWSQLKEKLQQNLYPDETIEKAMEYVKSFGYVDDHRYAVNFVKGRQGFKSKREIEALLMQKGISKELLTLAMEECYDKTEEKDAIRKLMAKKRIDPFTASEEELQKFYGYLARKGFRYEDIRQVIQDCRENA